MSELKLFDHRCRRCGGALEANGNVFVCGYCGNTYAKAEVEDAAKKLGELLDEQKQEAVANLRYLLWNAVHEEYVSNKEVERLCKEILAYLPEDFFANFYLATCSKNKTALGSFLYAVDIDGHYDDIPDILDYILKGLKSDWTMATGNFIERAYKSNDLKLYHKYRTKFEIENAKIEECVYDPPFRAMCLWRIRPRICSK